MIDRKAFFDFVRRPLFNSKMNIGQVETMDAFIFEYEARKMTDKRFLAYILATAYHEAGRDLQPIKEIGRGRGKRYGRPDPRTGQIYYGRGFVQLTWYDNYEKLGELLGVDLLSDPDRALNKGIAIQIIFEGMIRGLYTGKRLAHYFNNDWDDALHARQIVNRMDRAKLIQGYHVIFLTALSR